MSPAKLQFHPCVLRLGPPAGSQPDAIDLVLKKARLPVIALPLQPPASPDAFRQLVRQAGFALLDFDQNAPALRWLNALRTHRPRLPIFAVFQHADLPELLPAGVAGLDGAIHLPATLEYVTTLLQPWLPDAPLAPSHRPDSLFAAIPPSPRADHLPSTYIANASEANRELLQTLVNHPDATRFVASGPAGAEFSLLALELAARRAIPETEITFDDGPVAPIASLIVTRDMRQFDHSRAPFALLLVETTPAGTDNLALPDCAVKLELKPLRFRLADVAHYTARWLPLLAAAAHQPAPVLPLPTAWRHALLSHTWPGEFTELWHVLRRLALLSPGAPLPSGLPATAAGDDNFKNLSRLATPRAYREQLGKRIPADILPSVLGALGCPDLP
jgi:hypothetical protein